MPTMLDRRTTVALNRLFITIYRSLPMYLTYAAPWCHRGDERIEETLRHLVADHKAICARIAEYLQEQQAPLNTGDYPMGFTDLHDLSLDYLVSRMIRCQQQDIAVIANCVQELKAVPTARTLAEESLGAARAHLESLEQLAATAKAAAIAQP
jgi:hypothetical protein